MGGCVLVECPHCSMRVFVGSDGLCPSCSADTNDLEGADVLRTRVRLREWSELPPRCCQCAAPTDRRVDVVQSQTRGGESGLAKVALLFAALLSPVKALALLAGSGGETRRFSVSLPLCLSCETASGVPEPVHVNFEEGAISFLVHRSFAEGVRT